jgi:hypothetical protein
MNAGSLEALLVRSADRRGRASQLRRAYGIGEYLFIGGDRMSARVAAERLGVSPSTINRYRAVLRDLVGRTA